MLSLVFLMVLIALSLVFVMFVMVTCEIVPAVLREALEEKLQSSSFGGIDGCVDCVVV